MDDQDWLARRFEDYRTHLRAVAYRMLGSLTEADDAVQESWLRLSRSDTSSVENLKAWLTTVVGRVCLNMLQRRRAHREEPFGVHVPDPIVSHLDESGPEQEAVLADSVGLALLVVLDTLTPAERLSFVLHDMFAVSFDAIAPIVGRSPAAARQLASRARRRVQGAVTDPDADLSRQWEVVKAFLAASREGDFAALISVLDPDVVLRADRGVAAADESREVHRAEAVASLALTFAGLAGAARPALVNGAPGYVVAPGGVPFSVIGITIRHEKIVEIDILADPERLSRFNLVLLDDALVSDGAIRKD